MHDPGAPEEMVAAADRRAAEDGLKYAVKPCSICGQSGWMVVVGDMAPLRPETPRQRKVMDTWLKHRNAMKAAQAE